MRVLVFSDTHLTSHFDLARFTALQELIEQADQVIINGDFWDGYVVQFTDFLESAWNQLFPLLKSKQAVYIHGNHDRPEFIDDQFIRFADSTALEHRLKVGDIEYVFTHGHLISPAADDSKRVKKVNMRAGFWGLMTRTAAQTTLWLESLSTRMFGVAMFHVGGVHNIKIKRWAKRHLPQNQRLVCGHSHTAEINNRRRFFNSGAFNHGVASCLWITEAGVELVREKY